MTIQRMPTNSVALQAVLYFARQPDEALLPADVAAKFGCPPHETWRALRRVLESGLLAAMDMPEPSPRGSQQVTRRAICAGPALLTMIGIRPAAAANLPASIA